jgi:hypothetical protein
MNHLTLYGYEEGRTGKPCQVFLTIGMGKPNARLTKGKSVPECEKRGNTVWENVCVSHSTGGHIHDRRIQQSRCPQALAVQREWGAP